MVQKVFGETDRVGFASAGPGGSQVEVPSEGFPLFLRHEPGLVVFDQQPSANVGEQVYHARVLCPQPHPMVLKEAQDLFCIGCAIQRKKLQWSAGHSDSVHVNPAPYIFVISQLKWLKFGLQPHFS